MSKILLGNSSGKHVEMDIDVLLRTRLLIQADSGGGKSWLLRRIAEQVFGRVQVIIVDPEGEFATLREKFGYVLVGKGGETPADPRSAAMLAHKLLELKASAVCDIYELKHQARHQWVRLFLESLIDAPKNLWQPVLIVVDEAHVYCPEKGKGESEASGAMIDLATRGRKRGYAAVFATQRLGKLNKDASSELQNRLIGPTFEDINRKRAAEVLGILKQDERDFFREIQLLEPGRFYALGRAIATERILFNVGRVETTHPEPGSSKHAAEPPPPPEKVKALLPKLADLPKAAEEQARTVGELRAEIRSLKAQVAQRPVMDKPVKVIDQEAINRAVREVKADQRKQRKRLVDSLKLSVQALESAKSKIETGLTDLAAADEREQQDYTKYVAEPAERLLAAGAGRPALSIVRAEKPPAHASSGEAPKGIVAGALRMLSALAQWYPEGMTEGQMRAHAGMKKSGTYDTYMSRLKLGGLVERRGDLMYATEDGIEYCGNFTVETPRSTEEVVALWRPKLKASGAQRMLDVLVAHRGDAIPKAQLAEEAGITLSGTFDTYLSRLRTARLAETGSGMVAANRESLFL